MSEQLNPQNSPTRRADRASGKGHKPHRFNNTPLQLDFPEQLPVSAKRNEIASAIENSQVVIVAGETGSGKTTQLPKIALSIGRGSIVHTQPRRIAARAVAERIAAETGSELGGLVGYQVRFTDKSSKNTRLKVVTDGVLLNAIHHDRLLRAYDTVIIDEAHERSLNIDFLLGYLKTLLPKRPDLKLIITSATIDPLSFASHFQDAHGNPAPIIEVTGRSYPVDIRYRPLTPEHTEQADGGKNRTQAQTDIYTGVCQAASELLKDTSGDILAFFAGEGEIRDAADALHGYFNGASTARAVPGGKQVTVLPLYGRLSAAEQHRVFSPAGAGVRRIVLATNVAETSLTVPGITGVIDTGFARVSRYSNRSKVQRLPIEAVSQASATQRAGRAGRLAPGVAIRLYSEADFVGRPLFADPEILRTGLASVLLQMYALGLGQVTRFPFLTPPDQRGVRDGVALLAELGAIKNGQITPVGRALAKIPLEPRFARMLLEGMRCGISERMVALTAGLTVQDVREYPEAERERAATLHQRFHDPLGDLHTLLNLYDYLREQQQQLSSSAFRRQLKAEYINVVRVREWFDLVTQLTSVLRELKLPEKLLQAHPAAPQSPKDLVHYCALAGLLSHLGVRTQLPSVGTRPNKQGFSTAGTRRTGGEFLGSRGAKFVIHPGSVLARKPPETVMAVELVETSRLFARSVAAIVPEWAQAHAGDLAKSTISDPHWSKNQEAAVALERVTLYGVPIVVGRRVQLRRFDHDLARQLFIQEALVAGNWKQDHAFARHNNQLRRELAQLAHERRTHTLVGDDDTVYTFYDERVPAHIVTGSDFAAWWIKTQKREPKLLHLTRDDLLTEHKNTQLSADTEQDFPRVWRFQDQQLGLRYRFEPGAADDGVTVVVPLPLLPRLTAGDFAGLVPGMRHELVASLIKTLPKPIRKHVVPANEWARKLLEKINPQLHASTQAATTDVEPAVQNRAEADTNILTTLLAAEIRKIASLPVIATDFDLERLPAHLRPTFKVVNRAGKTVGSSKDLSALQQRFSARAGVQLEQVTAKALPKTQLEKTGLTAFPSDIEAIPEFVDASFNQQRSRAQGVVRAYLCFTDKRSHVDLVLVPDAHTAAAQHRLGIRRLVALSSPPIGSYVREHLSQEEKLLLAHSPYNSLDDLIADVALALADDCAQTVNPAGIRTAAEFAQCADMFAARLVQDSFQVVSHVAQLLLLARQAQKALTEVNSLALLPLVADAKKQLNDLIFATPNGGFISRTGISRLHRLPVYLQALVQRTQQMTQNPGRDRTLLNDIEKSLADFTRAGGTLPLPENAAPQLVQARWLLEELRVSYFAQQLGTAEKVSPQRIRKLLADF